MQNFFFDLLPIIIFFVVYKIYGIYAATASAIIISIIQFVYLKIRKKPIEKIQIITLVLIIVFGGATLFFHNPLFIKWKVSVVYWILSLGMLISQYVGNKPMVQRMLDQQVQLPKKIWLRLSWSWVIFFAFIGFVNLYVILNYSTNTWVDFKLFGILGLTIIFFIGQAIYLAKHIKQ